MAGALLYYKIVTSKTARMLAFYDFRIIDHKMLADAPR